MSTENKSLTLYFDGACAPRNPGGVATGGWVLFVDGQRFTDGSKEFCRGDGATNNVAEWSALHAGLSHLTSIPTVTADRTLTIRGDSQLVIRQLTGEYKMRAAHLKPIFDLCLTILKSLPCQPWKAEWVQREQNSIADDLSKQAYERATGQKFPEGF